MKYRGQNPPEIDDERFLKLLYPVPLGRNETLELRSYTPKTKNGMLCEHFANIRRFIAGVRANEGREIYFGVCTRADKGGDKAHCHRVPAVWVDWDKESDLDVAMAVKPQPNIIVASGGGLHLYWLLKTPLLLRVGDPVDDRSTKVEAVNRGLCKLVGGDDKAIDVARILRPPDTTSHKYDDERPVKAFLVHESRYTVDYFRDHGIYIAKPPANTQLIASGTVVSGLSASLQDRLATTGGGKKDSPSEEDFCVIQAMLREGVSSDDAYATFAASARGKDAMVRHPRFDDYMQRTINKAVSGWESGVRQA